MIVVGGNCGPWLSSVEVFDSESWQWRSGPELPIGIGAGSLVEDVDGGIVLLGGCSDSSEYLDSIYRLADVSADWIEMPKKLKTGRHAHTSFLVPDEIAACQKIN